MEEHAREGMEEWRRTRRGKEAHAIQSGQVVRRVPFGRRRQYDHTDFQVIVKHGEEM